MGELQYPYKSFKFDLIAFGLIIAKLLWKENYNNNCTWEFEKLCEKYRYVNNTSSLVHNDLHQLREKELSNVYDGKFNPSLAAYFNVVNEYDWYEKNSKNLSYYLKLIRAFV